MKAFDRNDLDAALFRWMVAVLVGFARQYDRDREGYPADAKEMRRKIWTRLHEVADKFRYITVPLED